ncbi:MAG: cupin domain-containing protein [Thiolinea sp.]
MSNIITLDEAEATAKHIPELQAWHAVLATGNHQELNWVKFAPGSVYPLHSHPYEQTSVLIQGRMRLTVGDEVREVGPGDMWFVAADVPHGGEILGGEAVIFIDLYSPPSGGCEEAVTYY